MLRRPAVASLLLLSIASSFVGMLVVGSLAVALFAMTPVERQLPPGVNGVHTSAGDGVGLKASVGEPSAAVGVVSG